MSKPCTNLLIWIFSARNIQNETAYIESIEKKINVQLLFRTYQVHSHSRTCLKYKKKEYRLSYGQYFIEKTIIAKPLDAKISNDENQEDLAW